MKSLCFFCGCFILCLIACHDNPLINNPIYELNNINSFVFAHSNNPLLAEDVYGRITTDSIYVELPYGANLASLTPTISYDGTSINPPGGTSQDFSSPVHYIVTAQNGNTKDYVVIASIHYKQKVFIGTNAGRFYAFDGDNGTVLWSYRPLPYGAIANEAAYGSNTVYFSTLYNFYALDATTGAVKWSYTLPYNLTTVSAIIINNGILYFIAGNLYALNANTGVVIWSQPGGPALDSPTYYNGKIYCSSILGVRSFDAITGQPLLTYGSNFTAGNILVSDNIVYACSESKALESYNGISGSLNWEFDEMGGLGFSGSGCSPTIHNGVLFTGGYSHYMYAVNSSTGQMIWKSNFIYAGSPSTTDFSAPTIANGLVYSTNGINTIALDEQTGDLRWSSLSTGAPCTVYNSSVFVAGPSFSLVSLNALTGLLNWRHNFSGEYPINAGSCVVTEDSRVFNSGASGGHQ